MIILGIETSCDETACALVESGTRVLANVIHSQILDHEQWGGVIPELASRRHLEFMLPVLDETLKHGAVSLEEIDAIAYTKEPGLLGALLVGINTATTLGHPLKKPTYPINHLTAHLYAAWLEPNDTSLLQFPLLFLTVSGGHTNIVMMHEHGKMEQLGQTLDDAAGEAFDKVATLLELGYPGGPAVQKAAIGGDPKRYALPRAMLDHPGYDFSFSGLKTATRRLLQEEKNLSIADAAASFQEAVVDSLLGKVQKAWVQLKPKHLVITGGVSANTRLREKATAIFGEQVTFPPFAYCTDNAAMVAGAGYFLQSIE